MFHFLLLFCTFSPSVICGDISQDQHDATERQMQSTLFAQKEQIADIWRPSKQLLSDYSKAEKCYVRFHLHKTNSCSKQLEQVQSDLSK